MSVQFLILGLAKFTAIGVSDYMQTCIKYSVWLIFMIYRMNEDKFDHIKAKHARIALARKTRAQRAVAAYPNISGAGQKRPAPHFLVKREEVGGEEN